MPFGFFGISEERKKEKKVKEVPVAKVQPQPQIPKVEPVVIDGKKLSILLIGETVEICRDFICSLKLNLDESVVKGGLSCFTTDNFTTAAIIDAKKNIERCFRGEADVRWPVYSDNARQEITHYKLNVAVAGVQEKVLEVDFAAATVDMNLTGELAGSNSVWFLVPDGSEEGIESVYESQVKSFIFANGSALKEKKVFCVVSQFEKRARFRDDGADSELPVEEKNGIMESVRRMYQDSFKTCGVVAKVCMAQIYGGLEFLEKDSMGRSVFFVNLDGSFGSYCPIGCHMPLFHTINSVRNDGLEFFYDANGERLHNAILKGFSDYNGRKQWNPQIIGLENE